MASVMLVAAAASLIRLVRWEGHRTLREPLLWGLHLSYAFVPVGLTMWAMALLGAFRVELALHALAIGGIAGAVCFLAIQLKYKFGYDDSLDVVGVHLVAGLWGTLSLGFFATGTGLFYGGGIAQLAIQAIIALVAIAFTARSTVPLSWPDRGAVIRKAPGSAIAVRVAGTTRQPAARAAATTATT
jgi:hypothetical protein